ncbi:MULTISPECIES: P-loop NTPase family protein [Photorhabdus]|uniref:Adenylate kinase n=2 Tax=Photorhabdus asymbiotica TaxID=291112 RepID=C7BKM3_PHOAA|nr:hypothetical protein [Photorhabdus asymbiotica]RKS57961.1 hypothetical protein BDD30_2789 [Photorhabdus asymbiotica]CAQ82709.1 conserved hypothetical protein [Photorhabdus asymbiotica]
MIRLNDFKGRKILIVGRPCSGKTSLGKQLSETTGINLFDLDDIYWEKGWRRPDDATFKENLKQVLELEEWIIAGNYLQTLAFRMHYCSDIIILNCTWYKAVYRYFRRIVMRACKKERNTSYSGWYREFNIKFFFKKIVFYYKFYHQFNEAINKSSDCVKIHRY